MGVKLTEGAIARMFSNDSVYSSDIVEIDLILQIVEVENRCLWLSDGTNSDVGLLSGHMFNSFFIENLEKGSVVKLTTYSMSRSSNRVIFILDCDVVLEKCDIIGEPTPLPKYGNSNIIGEPAPLPKFGASQPQPDEFGYFNCLELNDLGFYHSGFSYLSLDDDGKTKCSAKGPLEIMFSCANHFNSGELLLQVMQSLGNYISLSDGKNICFALPPQTLVDELRYYEIDDILSSRFKYKLLNSTMPKPGSIVKLNNYILKEFYGHKFIIIFDFDLVFGKHVVIGSPFPLYTNPSLSCLKIAYFLPSCPPLNLSEGAIPKILGGNFSSDKGFKPVLQALLWRETNIVLSDGVYCFNLNCCRDLRGRFLKWSSFPVIKLTDYCVTEDNENHKDVVILDLQVILHSMSTMGDPVIPPNEAITQLPYEPNESRFLFSGMIVE